MCFCDFTSSLWFIHIYDEQTDLTSFVPTLARPVSFSQAQSSFSNKTNLWRKTVLMTSCTMIPGARLIPTAVFIDLYTCVWPHKNKGVLSLLFFSYLRHPVLWKKDSGSLIRSEPVVWGRTTRSIKTGRAIFSRSGFRLSAEDKFHSRPGGKNENLSCLSSTSVKCSFADRGRNIVFQIILLLEVPKQHRVLLILAAPVEKSSVNTAASCG